MRVKRALGCGAALSILLAGGGRAWAVLSINTLQYINQDVGATTFYENGFTGSSAVIANIEAGYIWNQQLLLTQDTVEFSDPSITGQVDLHATAVGSVINGLVPFDGFVVVNNTLLPIGVLDGIAPTAQVWSGAIATSWNDVGGNQYSTSFNITNASFSTPYLEAMVTGVPEANYQTADVITSSWETSSDPDGDDYLALVLDSLVGESGKTLVLAAGNGGPTGNTVNAPASGTNALVVGALQSDSTTPAYSQIASFSSVSPTDFFIPGDPYGFTGTELVGVRARIDITAPGTDMILAFYGGNTGGGAFGYGAPNPDPTLVAYPFSGTSFSAPIVASGAGLVVDAGKTLFSNDPDAIDGRVIKAVLMNSADKPTDWNNGQFTNGNGVIFTSQALDYSFGAGMLDLNQAWTQYTGGTTDVLDITGKPTLGGGSVQTTGWAFGHITHIPGGTATVDYTFNAAASAGSILSATLDWYSNELTTETADGLVPKYGSFDNLDLSVFLLGGGSPQLVAESASLYNSVQELYFALPQSGTYMLEVSENTYLWNFTKDTTTDYGLAWSTTAVPEPASAALLAAGMALLLRRRHRRDKRIKTSFIG
jgi:subtilase family protein